MRKIRFFLDYGICFWPVDPAYEQDQLAKELLCLLSDNTKTELEYFLLRYDQSYSWGLPPSTHWTVDDCIEFNSICKSILHQISQQTNSSFTICDEQLLLTEDPEVLDAFSKIKRDFFKIRKEEYYGIIEKD